MIFEIQGPDGNTYEIDAPDEKSALSAFQGMSQQAQPEAPQSPEFQSALADMSAMTQNPARAQYDNLPAWQKPLVAASDILQLAGSGASFGFGEKAAAAVRAPFTDKTYEEELAAQRALTQGARNRAGGAGTVAEIGGAIAAPMGLAGKGITLAGRLGTGAMQGAGGLAARTGLMGMEGAGYGALTAAGNDQDITTGAGIGALGGVGGNLVGEALSAGASKIAGMFNAKPNIPSIDDLRSSANAAYDAADNAGVVFSPQGVSRLGNDIRVELANFGFHPGLQPRIATVLDELERVQKGNVTLKGIDVLRRITDSARKSMDPSEKALGNMIIEKIDDFIANARPGEVLAGNSKDASKAISEARNMWGRMRRSEQVADAIGKADLRAASTGSGGNADNATRQNIRRLLEKGRGFTADEKAAMEKIVRGSPGQNALRLAGKLSPQGNGLMAALGIGGTMVNPMIGAASLGGMAAKTAADGMTQANVKALQDIILAGSKSAATGSKNAAQRLAEAKREAIARALMDAMATNAGAQ
jgi:hypothetical protein